MKKSDYLKYLDPKEFAELYDEWAAAGKPQGNHTLYTKIWNGVTNAVKACIGALQSRYHCQYQDYDDKVLDGTITMINRLLKLDDTPNNIVTMSYLPMLGICCGKKTIQQEFEDSMLSTDVPTEGGDTFKDLIDGEVQYINY